MEGVCILAKKQYDMNCSRSGGIKSVSGPGWRRVAGRGGITSWGGRLDRRPTVVEPVYTRVYGSPQYDDALELLAVYEPNTDSQAEGVAGVHTRLASTSRHLV